MGWACDERGLRGARVLTLRQAEGLTQAELAERLEVSQGFISQVEKELKPLPGEMAESAARQFDLPIEYFTVVRGRTDEGIPTYRKSSKASAKEEAKVLAAFGDAARLFQVASERSGYHVVELDDVREFDEEVTARNVRSLLGLGTEEPILNATRALERLGVGVLHNLVEMGEELVEHTGISRPTHLVDRPMVATIGPLPPAVSRMTVMHELGHLIYDRERAIPIRGVRAPEERRAYLFAGAMLIPAPVITQRVTESLALTGYLRIKADYGVSVGALVQRAASLGAISAQRKRSLFIQLSSQGWRRAEPVAVAAETAILVRQASERGIAKTAREVARATGTRFADAKRWTGLEDDRPASDDNIIPFGSPRHLPR